MSASPKLVLYYTFASPCCRAVLMCIKELGLDIKPRVMDLAGKAEQREGWFVKMNPQHIVPTIDDDGFILWESRVINSYLVNKFSVNNPLIPADMKLHATMDRLLHFDLGTLYPSMVNYFRPQLLQGAPPDPVHGAELERCLGLLDIFLRDKEFAAGTINRTLADLSLLATVTQLEGYDYSYSQHRNVTCWANRLKQELPYYHEISDDAIEKSRAWSKQRLKLQNRNK